MHFFFLFKSREIGEPKSLTFLNCFFFFSNQLGLSDVRIILFQVGKTLKIVLEEEKMCFFYIDLLTLIKITYPKHTCIYEVVRKSKGGGNCGCEAQLMKTAIPKAFSNGSFPCARACRSTWSSGGPFLGAPPLLPVSSPAPPWLCVYRGGVGKKRQVEASPEGKGEITRHSGAGCQALEDEGLKLQLLQLGDCEGTPTAFSHHHHQKKNEAEVWRE